MYGTSKITNKRHLLPAIASRRKNKATKEKTETLAGNNVMPTTTTDTKSAERSET